MSTPDTKARPRRVIVTYECEEEVDNLTLPALLYLNMQINLRCVSPVRSLAFL